MRRVKLKFLSLCRVHLTLMPSRRRTSWRELPSPTVKHVHFLTKQINQEISVEFVFYWTSHTQAFDSVMESWSSELNYKVKLSYWLVL